MYTVILTICGTHYGSFVHHISGFATREAADQAVLDWKGSVPAPQGSVSAIVVSMA